LPSQGALVRAGESGGRERDDSSAERRMCPALWGVLWYGDGFPREARRRYGFLELLALILVRVRAASVLGNASGSGSWMDCSWKRRRCRFL
jgi:hypothetical protein